MTIKQNNIDELKSLVVQYLPAHVVKSYEIKTIKVSQFVNGTQGSYPYLYHLVTPVVIVSNWQFHSSNGCACGRFASKTSNIFVALNGVLYLVRSNDNLELILASSDNSKIENPICAKIKQLEDEIAALKKQINC